VLSASVYCSINDLWLFVCSDGIQKNPARFIAFATLLAVTGMLLINSG
jgi:hypothetical protein